MAEMQVIEVEGVTVIAVTGEMTGSGIAPIERAFVMTVAAAERLVVDLSAVTMISTPGITLLVSADRQLRRRHGRFVLCGLAGRVEQVLLERCRLDAVFTIRPSRVEAIAAARL
ncbi:MAG: STAS domain-containing protein [Phycisphaerae bacterium]|nr:STAS domain-containing protein [Phycisphaerae bacterium]MDW8261884.1 STAS domain-containing protein [Phycisphaerales bacterium]